MQRVESIHNHLRKTKCISRNFKSKNLEFTIMYINRMKRSLVGSSVLSFVLT